MAFYQKVFETEPAQIMTYGQMPHDNEHSVDENIKYLVLNANLKINDTNVMFSDSPESIAPPVTIGNNVSLVFNAKSSEEAAKIFERLAENGTILLPLAQTF